MFRIREIRTKKGVTQTQLAKKAGLSRAIISALENEKRAVTTTETIKKIANALDVKVSDIFLD